MIAEGGISSMKIIGILLIIIGIIGIVLTVLLPVRKPRDRL